MKIIVEPHRNNDCIVWLLNRNTFKCLNGTSREICDKIYKFCTCTRIDEKGRKITEQIVDIAIEYSTIGMFFIDYLTELGLKCEEIKLERELLS